MEPTVAYAILNGAIHKREGSLFMKIEEKIAKKRNNFDFMRFIAACLVIFSHSMVLSGISFDPYEVLTGIEKSGALAVNIFFVISGFLITKSWVSKPEFTHYFKNRILRIIPGLAVTAFFCAFIVGPLCTKLNLLSYFCNSETYKFMLNIMMYPVRYHLPGVFTDNPYPNSVNSSLWTLPIEFFFYCSVAAIGMIKGFNKRALVFPVILGMMLLYFLVFSKPEFSHAQILFMHIHKVLRCGIFFFMGMMFFLYRDKISLTRPAFLAAILFFLLSFNSAGADIMNFILLPYIIIYSAFSEIPIIDSIFKNHDFSYGLYVYSFPIQQTLLHFLKNSILGVPLFITSFLISLVMAFFSWKFIEKPALNLKNHRIFKPKFIKIACPPAEEPE